jgi:tRNA-specific 2-thiouridylase
MIPVSHPGPLVLLDGEADADDLELAARIAARFSKGRDAAEVTMEVTEKDGAVRKLLVAPLPSAQIPQEWYL